MEGGRERGGGFVCCAQNERGDEGLNGFSPFFKMKNYTQKHHRTRENQTFYTYPKDLGHFVKNLVGRRTAIRLFKENQMICYGGYFRVDRDVIQRQNIDIYEVLLGEQKFTFEEVIFTFITHQHGCHIDIRSESHPFYKVDHYIERLWTPLFRSHPVNCSSRKEDNEVLETIESWPELRKEKRRWVTGRGAKPQKAKYIVRREGNKVLLAAVVCCVYLGGLVGLCLLRHTLTIKSKVKDEGESAVRERRMNEKERHPSEEGSNQCNERLCEQSADIYLCSVYGLFIVCTVLTILAHYLLSSMEGQREGKHDGIKKNEEVWRELVK
jgi:hypothetical protein